MKTNSESLEVINAEVVAEEVEERVLEHAAMAVATEGAPVSGGTRREL